MAKEQKKLEQHPLAKLFPSPDSGTLDALKKRIFHAGKLKTPVVLFEGKVIEHWPEYGACVEFSLPFTTMEYNGTEDELVEHLLQANTLQLGKVHRALLGAYLKKLYRKESQANQSAGGSGATFIPKYHARDAAAEKMKISPRLIADAERILDTGNDKLLELALAGTLSVSLAAKLAKEKSEELDSVLKALEESFSKYLPVLNTEKLQTEDKLRTEYEKDIRYIKSVYKDKRQVLNQDARRRLSLADTPEEKVTIREGLKAARHHLAELQSVRLEKARLAYEKKRASVLKANAQHISKFRKACQEEAANESLGKETQYLVYMRWNYELGKLELHAAWDEVQHYDKATDICTLKSGRKVRYEAEAIALVYTAEIAKATAEAINRKGFCSGQKVLRPDSRVPRIFDRVGARVMKKIQVYLDRPKHK